FATPGRRFQYGRAYGVTHGSHFGAERLRRLGGPASPTRSQPSGPRVGPDPRSHTRPRAGAGDRHGRGRQPGRAVAPPLAPPRIRSVTATRRKAPLPRAGNSN